MRDWLEGHCWEEGGEGESGQKVDRNMVDRKEERKKERRRRRTRLYHGRRRRGADEVSDR